MSLNPKIISKIHEECKDKPLVKHILLELLQVELTGTGWWKEKYRDIISNACEVEEE